MRLIVFHSHRPTKDEVPISVPKIWLIIGDGDDLAI